MRITGGRFRGRHLKRVEKPTTRETADMVKLAVFNMLGPLDGVVLDLFAGSGAYGIEALSRGAHKAVLIDHDRDAIDVIKANIAGLNLLDQTLVLNMDAFSYMQSRPLDTFDLVFLDPPYALPIDQHLLEPLVQLTHPSSRVVCETDKKRVMPEQIGPWEKIKDKTYGIKRITFYQRSLD